MHDHGHCCHSNHPLTSTLTATTKMGQQQSVDSSRGWRFPFFQRLFSYLGQLLGNKALPPVDSQPEDVPSEDGPVPVNVEDAASGADDSVPFEEGDSEILEALDREQMVLVASAAFRRLHSPMSTENSVPSVGDPIFGSYNVVLPLTFDNGLRWAVKIPLHGDQSQWDEASSQALASEAYTMQLIKRETTIPVPEVFDFSTTIDNPLCCPYIMMSFIDGLPLYEVWHSHGVDANVNQAHRIRALKDIASAMAQLGKLSFDTSGRLIPVANGKPLVLGPSRRVDHTAMFANWADDDEDDNDDVVFSVEPVTADPKKHYTVPLDKHQKDDAYLDGLALLMRELIAWIPEPTGVRPFVLAHPDCGLQNFLVSEEGELRGIIDWDGVKAVPRSVGNEKYPNWLTNDWDPATYTWREGAEMELEEDEEMELEEDEDMHQCEDSPQTLAFYRNIYHEAMTQLVSHNESTCGVDICRSSLVAQTLARAIDDPLSRQEGMHKIVRTAWTVAIEHNQSQGNEGQEQVDKRSTVELNLDCPFYANLAEDLLRGTVDKQVMETLKKGFHILRTKEVRYVKS